MTRKRTGRPPTHGAYALLKDLARGLDKRSRDAQALRRVTRDLVASLGASSLRDLDGRQRRLVEQAALLSVITMKMGVRAIADGVVGKDGAVVPTLRTNWLAYQTRLMKVLEALGLSKDGAAPDIGKMLADERGEAGEEAKR